MSNIRLYLCIFLIIGSICGGFTANTNQIEARTLRRIHIPLLGLGPRCTGCPQHFCDDDPAIIHGYCCGCARFFDILPVKCSPFVECPLNTHEVCQDYEYMMHCCCD